MGETYNGPGCLICRQTESRQSSTRRMKWKKNENGEEIEKMQKKILLGNKMEVEKRRLKCRRKIFIDSKGGEEKFEG